MKWNPKNSLRCNRKKNLEWVYIINSINVHCPAKLQFFPHFSSYSLVHSRDSRDFFVKHYTVKRKAEITVNIHSSRLWNSRYIQAKVYVNHPNFRVCAQRKFPVKRFKISHYTKIQSCFLRVKVLYFFPQMNGTGGHKIWQIQVLIW